MSLWGVPPKPTVYVLASAVPVLRCSSFQVLNEGGKYKVVVTKNLPGTKWIDILKLGGCEVHLCRSDKTILDVPTIKALIGSKCDGVIGQLTEVGST